ncbi:MAG: single-stranded DNA-binding protein [Chloracidobacterium sp.]|nr:single-stranded DNA-binding protein [Chloracidobacterium sp.]MCC6824438.1 single-stranded DNA-binding protein [Acidobacteriota bacterium]
MSFNKIILVGNLGRDPELRFTPQGKAVCSFSMATNEKRRDKSGEFQDVTTWFKVTLWGNQAENANKYLSKGRPVYIEGRLRIEEWTDRDNNNRYTLDVQATDMQFISAGRDDTAGSSSYSDDHEPQYTGAEPSAKGSSSANAPVAVPDSPEDDIPF